MKRCPTCNRTYADLSLNFCLDDGTPLTSDAAPTTDLNATIRYPPPRDTAEPPPTEIYRPPPPTAAPRPTAPPHAPPQQPQQWSPAPPKKRSNAVWWILGGFVGLVVIGLGIGVMLIALTSLSSRPNINTGNVNTRNANRNANALANANGSNVNANANANVGPPTSLFDDFSQQKWSTATSQYGRVWYANDEYHMTSKERTFIVMYAPSNDYNSENATVRVTARLVDGSVPSNGFGLMVHCVQSRTGQLEDYALLIYPSDDPEYEVIMHKAGNQSTLVARTESDAIRPGSATNQLEVRIKGNQIAFFANGRPLTTMLDRENYRRGRVGFYTSDISEVAFDDLQIERSPGSTAN